MTKEEPMPIFDQIIRKLPQIIGEAIATKEIVDQYDKLKRFILTKYGTEMIPINMTCSK